MNVTIFRKILKLCEEFQKQKDLTPSEYIAEKASNEEEYVQYNFLNLQRHDKILQEIVEHFIKYNAITIRLDIIRFKLMFYILIFAFKQENPRGIEKIFIVSNKITHVEKVLLYYSDEQNQILTARIACKYFENEYVLNNIVHPIMENGEYFEQIFEILVEYENNQYKISPTVPVELNLSKKGVKFPTAPVNTPKEIEYFRSTPIPKTTYCPDLKVQSKLSKEYEKNKQKALELLEKSKNLPDYTKPPKPKEHETKPIEQFKRPKRIRMKDDIPIKPNLTTIIREAALYAKEKETCIKEINEIMKGGVDTELVKTLEEQIREEGERKQIEDIERKRLKCLLSHEEAVIAKCQVKARNKLKYYEMLKESEELKKKLLDWKEKMKEEYKTKIEKAQESNRNAKESERQMMKDKHSNARLLQWESKMLLTKALEEKEKELGKKIQIIQEIKAMHEVKKADTSREFDKTECTNLGLLCEMSIAELEERLNLMKIEAQQKLDEKREDILRKKEERNKMIQDAREFIEQHRSVRVKTKKTEVKTVKESEDIKLLKKKIEEAKRIREACKMCPCRPCPVIIAHSNK